MAFVHVYPESEEHEHTLNAGADCQCEPRVTDEGRDEDGQPARVFVHRPLNQVDSGAVRARCEGWHPPKRKLGRG